MIPKNSLIPRLTPTVDESQVRTRLGGYPSKGLWRVTIGRVEETCGEGWDVRLRASPGQYQKTTLYIQCRVAPQNREGTIFVLLTQWSTHTYIIYFLFGIDNVEASHQRVFFPLRLLHVTQSWSCIDNLKYGRQRWMARVSQGAWCQPRTCY
jgi:hypothetical protein